MVPPEAALSPRPALLAPSLDDLGVRLGADGGTLRIWSGNADSMHLVVFDDVDLDWAVETVPMTAVGGGVFEATSPLLRPGARYAVRAVFDIAYHGDGKATQARDIARRIAAPGAPAIARRTVAAHGAARFAAPRRRHLRARRRVRVQGRAHRCGACAHEGVRGEGCVAVCAHLIAGRERVGEGGVSDEQGRG